MKDTQREVADLIRKAAKEMYWASNNLSKVYNLIKPDDAEIFEVDPNQMSLFGDEEEEK